MHDWFCDYLSNSKQFVSIGENISDLCIIRCRVPQAQGSVLGPLLFMAALRSRCGHSILPLWFLSTFLLFSSPILSNWILDVYHTSIHDVALVRI